MNLSERITALEQREAARGFEVWFKVEGVYFKEPGVPVELPANANGLIFEFSDEVDGAVS